MNRTISLPLTGGIPQPLNRLRDCLIAVERASALHSLHTEAVCAAALQDSRTGGLRKRIDRVQVDANSGL